MGKMYSNEPYLPTIRSLIDMAGGVVSPDPSGDDYANKELRPFAGFHLLFTISTESSKSNHHPVGNRHRQTNFGKGVGERNSLYIQFFIY
jgi:hypothetical protein